MAFNINAHVILSGPKNIKAVTKNIQQQLGTVNAKINLVAPKNLSKQLGAFNQGISNLNKSVGTLQTSANTTNAHLKTLDTSFKSLNKSSGKMSKTQSNVQKSLDKTGQAVGEVRSEIEAFGKDAALAIRRFSAFTIATGVIFGFVRAIQGATKAAIAYEREIVKVVQVTSASADKIKGLNASINQLSVSLGVDANELAELARMFAQTGQTIDQVQKSIRAVARSSLTPTFGSMKDTAEGLIAAMAQFNIAASQQEAVLASLNAVSKKFAVESEDLISVIRRAGGVFAASRKGFEEPIEGLQQLIGIFTAVRSTTRESADTIAVGLRTIFTRIQRRGTIDFLKQFNIELVDVKGNFVGLFPAFQQLSKGLDDIIKSGDALTLSAITEELGGVRQVGKLIPAITQFNKALEATKIAGDAAKKGLGSDVKLALQPLGKQFELLQQRFNALIRDITQSKTFQNMAKVAISMANAFLSVAETLKPLLPMVATLAAIKISKGLVDFGSGFIGGMRKGGGAGGIGGTLGGIATGGGGGGKGGGGSNTALISAINSSANVQKGLRTAVQGLSTAGMQPLRLTIEGLKRSLEGNNTRITSSITNAIGAMGTLINALNRSAASSMRIPSTTTPPRKKFATGGRVYGPSHAQGGVNAVLEGGEYVIPKGYAGGGISTLEAGKPYVREKRFKWVKGATEEFKRKGDRPNRFNEDDSITYTRTNRGINVKNEYPTPRSRQKSAVARKYFHPTTTPIDRGLAFEKILKEKKIISQLVGGSARLDAVTKGGKASEIKSTLEKLREKALNEKMLGAAIDPKGFVSDKIVADKLKQSKLTGKGDTVDLGSVVVFQDVTGDLGKGMRSRQRSRQRRVKGRAAGGSVFAPQGTDTVPAMLTPGEFVVNRKSAENFGYGNLKKINQYAKGGVAARGNMMQYFSHGGEHINPDVRLRSTKTRLISDPADAQQVADGFINNLVPALRDALSKSVGKIVALPDLPGAAMMKMQEVAGGDKLPVAKGGMQPRTGKIGVNTDPRLPEYSRADVETVEHEIVHAGDTALGLDKAKSGSSSTLTRGEMGFSSQQEGSFQNVVAGDVQGDMAASMHAAGKSAEEIAASMDSNTVASLKLHEVFARFVPNMDKELQSILLSTNDLDKGLASLAENASVDQLAQLPAALQEKVGEAKKKAAKGARPSGGPVHPGAVPPPPPPPPIPRGVYPEAHPRPGAAATGIPLRGGLDVGPVSDRGFVSLPPGKEPFTEAVKTAKKVEAKKATTKKTKAPVEVKVMETAAAKSAQAVSGWGNAVAGSVGAIGGFVAAFSSMDFSSPQAAMSSLMALSFAVTQAQTAIAGFAALTKVAAASEVAETTANAASTSSEVTETAANLAAAKSGFMKGGKEGLGNIFGTRRKTGLGGGAKGKGMMGGIEKLFRGFKLRGIKAARGAGGMGKAAKGLLGATQILKGFAPMIGKLAAGAGVGAIASMIVGPIGNAISDAVLGKKEEIAPGVTGRRGVKAGAAGAASGAVGAAQGAAMGAAIGTALLPGIGTAIGALGGVIIGGIKGLITGKASQAEFNAVEQLQKSSAALAKTFEHLAKLGDDAGAAALEKVNVDLEQRLTDTMDVFDKSKAKHASEAMTSWGNMLETGMSARGIADIGAISEERQMANLGSEGFLSSMGNIFDQFSGGMFPGSQRRTEERARKGRGMIAQKGLLTAADQIKPEDLEAMNVALQSMVGRFVNDMAALEQEGSLEALATMDPIGELDTGTTTAADNSIKLDNAFKTLGDTLKNAEGGTGAFSEQLNRLVRNALKTHLIKDVAEELKILEKANPKMATELAVGFSELNKTIDWSKDSVGDIKDAIKELKIDDEAKKKLMDIAEARQREVVEMAKQAAVLKLAEMAAMRARKALDALAAGLDQFGAKTAGIADQTTRLAGQVEAEFAQITGEKTIGDIDRFNPFENVAASSDQQIDAAISQLQSLGKDDEANVAFKDMGGLIKAQRDMPLIMRNVLNDLKLGKGAGGEVSNLEVEEAIIGKKATATEAGTGLLGAGVELPPQAMSALVDSIAKAGDRQDGEVFSMAKLTEIFEKDGEVLKLLGEVSANATEELSKAFEALGQFKNSLLVAAKLQQEMAKRRMEGELAILDKQESIRDKVNSALGVGTIDAFGQAVSDLQKRMGIKLTGGLKPGEGQVPVGGNVLDPQVLFDRLKTLDQKRETARGQMGMLTGQAAQMGTGGDATKLAKEMRENSDELGRLNSEINGTEAALKELANDTRMLAAIEGKIHEQNARSKAAEGTFATMVGGLSKYLKGDMDTKEFNKQILKPLDLVERAFDPGQSLSATEGADLFEKIRSGDPLVAGRIRTKTEQIAKDRGLDTSDPAVMQSIRKEVFDNLTANLGGSMSAIGEKLEIPGFSKILEEEMNRMFEAQDEAESLGAIMQQVGDMQVSILQKTMDREEQKLAAVLDKADAGFQKAALDFQAAVKEFALFRGGVTADEIQVVGKEVEAAQGELRTAQAGLDLLVDPKTGEKTDAAKAEIKKAGDEAAAARTAKVKGLKPEEQKKHADVARRDAEAKATAEQDRFIRDKKQKVVIKKNALAAKTDLHNRLKLTHEADKKDKEVRDKEGKAAEETAETGKDTAATEKDAATTAKEEETKKKTTDATDAAKTDKSAAKTDVEKKAIKTEVAATTVCCSDITSRLDTINSSIQALGAGGTGTLTSLKKGVGAPGTMKAIKAEESEPVRASTAIKKGVGVLGGPIKSLVDAIPDPVKSAAKEAHKPILSIGKKLAGPLIKTIQPAIDKGKQITGAAAEASGLNKVIKGVGTVIDKSDIAAGGVISGINDVNKTILTTSPAASLVKDVATKTLGGEGVGHPDVDVAAGGSIGCCAEINKNLLLIASILDRMLTGTDLNSNISQEMANKLQDVQKATKQGERGKGIQDALSKVASGEMSSEDFNKAIGSKDLQGAEGAIGAMASDMGFSNLAGRLQQEGDKAGQRPTLSQDAIAQREETLAAATREDKRQKRGSDIAQEQINKRRADAKAKKARAEKNLTELETKGTIHRPGDLSDEGEKINTEKGKTFHRENMETRKQEAQDELDLMDSEEKRLQQHREKHETNAARVRDKHRAEDIAGGRGKPTAAERKQQMQRSKGTTAEAVKDEDLIGKIQERERKKKDSKGATIGTSAGRRPEDKQGRLSDFMNAARVSPDADTRRHGMSYGTTALPSPVQREQEQRAMTQNINQQRGVGVPGTAMETAKPKVAKPEAAAGNVFEELRKTMQGKEIAEKMSMVFETGGDYVAKQIREAFKGAIPSQIEMTGQLGAIQVHLTGGKVLEDWSKGVITTVEGIIQTKIEEALGKDRAGKEEMGTNTSSSRNALG